MRELSLHLLDLAENSVTAGANCITITVNEDLTNDRLSLRIEDDGKGMDEDTARRVSDPFVTSRTTRKVGLGIPLLKAAAESCNGNFQILSAPGKGTTIWSTFQYSHIDRMPLGNLEDTFLNLLIAHPEIRWIFKYSINDAKDHVYEFDFDAQPVKEILDGVPLTDPSVLSYLQGIFSEGISEQKNKFGL